MCQSTKIEKSKAHNSNEKMIVRLLTNKTVLDNGKLILAKSVLQSRIPLKLTTGYLNKLCLYPNWHLQIFRGGSGMP